MTYLLHAIGYIWLLKRFISKESILDVILITCLLLPDILHIEATNFIMVVLIVFVGFFTRGNKICFSKEIGGYLIGLGIVALITSISWLVSGGINFAQACAAVLGLVRYPLIIWNVSIYENAISSEKNILRNKFYNAVFIMNTVNILACIFQKLDKNRALQLFSTWYSYSKFYVNELAHASKYYRAYGTWENPMSLGVDALICVSIMLVNTEFRKKKTWLLNILLCMVIGTMSLTKTFFLGSVIFLICAYILIYSNFFRRKAFSWKTLIAYMSGICAIPVIVYLFRIIYVWSRQAWPHLHYYLGYVINPQEAMASRLFQNGSLNRTLDIIKDNFLIGVGPVSIRGELVGDNEYIVLLHGGGIVALIMVLLILFSWIMKCVYRKDLHTVIIFLMWMLSGFSAPVLFHYKICLLPISYYFFIASYGGRESSETTKVIYD